jgi:hypothetical protein
VAVAYNKQMRQRFDVSFDGFCGKSLICLIVLQTCCIYIKSKQDTEMTINKQQQH